MLHEEKRKHSKEQQASNFITNKLVKTNKTVKSTRILSIASYIIFKKAFKIHIIKSYLCDQS